jgi:HAD superfamily hydrolase (TIGR01484 family)
MIPTEKMKKGTSSGTTWREDCLKPAKLVMFDLDGTLAESKAPLDGEMAGLLCQLLEKTKVAVISGASFVQFQSQFLNFLHCDGSEKSGEKSALTNLLILPTVGASFYRYEAGGKSDDESGHTKGQWKLVYEKKLTPEEEKLIEDDLKQAVTVAASHAVVVPEKVYGERVENRGTQVTFSALGQQAPLAEKAAWDPDHAKREEIVRDLTPLLPDFEIEIGGMTSIDITKKGMNKEHGIIAAIEYLDISKDDVLYVGDSLFPGGNDYGAVTAGVRTVAVKDIAETKKLIREYLSQTEK